MKKTIALTGAAALVAASIAMASPTENGVSKNTVATPATASDILAKCGGCKGCGGCGGCKGCGGCGGCGGKKS